MDGAGEVLENAPDPISEVKVEQVEIMNFGDGVDMMVFQSHGEEGGFEDAAEYAGVRMGLKGTTSEDEAKGGVRIRDCIGIVEYFEYERK